MRVRAAGSTTSVSGRSPPADGSWCHLLAPSSNSISPSSPGARWRRAAISAAWVGASSWLRTSRRRRRRPCKPIRRRVRRPCNAARPWLDSCAASETCGRNVVPADWLPAAGVNRACSFCRQDRRVALRRRAEDAWVGPGPSRDRPIPGLAPLAARARRRPCPRARRPRPDDDAGCGGARAFHGARPAGAAGRPRLDRHRQAGRDVRRVGTRIRQTAACVRCATASRRRRGGRTFCRSARRDGLGPYLRLSLYRVGTEAPLDAPLFVDVARRAADTGLGIRHAGRPLHGRDAVRPFRSRPTSISPAKPCRPARASACSFRARR